MQKKIRVYVSILLVTILLSSPLIFSKAFSVKACPPPPPETLLSLYLRSDLIAVADLTSRSDGEVTLDEETYQYFNVTRNLKISKVLKGKATRDFSYFSSEYRSKTPEEPSGEDETEIYDYKPYGYELYSELTPGNRYLFFFVKDEKTGEYSLADDVSGYKNLSDYDLGIHEKRIAELRSIVENKDNQLRNLTNWYIKCIEEKSTRWDGVMSLQNSFSALDYEEADEKDERVEFVFDENFSEYSPEIAESLTDSQKNYLSEIVFTKLQSTMFEGDQSDFYISLDEIVKRWDKPRLAIFAFSLFQTADQSNADQTNTAMRYIYSLLDDDKLWEIIEKYEATQANVEPENESTAENDGNESAALSEQEKTGQEELVEPDPSLEIRTETTENEVKLSAFQLREKALQDFTDRYNFLLARNFAAESVEEESAQK